MASNQKPEELLRHSPFFADFGLAELNIVTQYMDVRTGQRGDVLYFEGEPSDGMYIVGAGRVELLLNGDDGTARLVGWLGPAESFGELALLNPGKRLLTVRATNEVTLYELSVDSFMRMRAQHPDVCLLLIMSAVKRFGKVMEASHEIFRRTLLKQLERV